MKSKHPTLSLEYHRAIAEKLRKDPSLLQKAWDNVCRRRETYGHDAVAEWIVLLKAPVEKICELIVAESELADELRHQTVFAGILTERERTAIMHRVLGQPYSSTLH